MTAISRFRGDTVPDVMIITDASGVVVDITGYTFLLTINPNKAPTDNTAQLLQMAGVIVNAPAGQVSFTPTTNQANQAPGKYYYDVQMTDGLGKITTIVLDTYTFKQDITKS